ncbi:MAG TPA: 2-succinyl-5-enolpyruvyl-6-hydroxy-3-cyclohexene-1-carboxylic-acid synthase [Longimicrobiales bacterium]|nr:2-succinyl-5-enolpyruvyl-6-hydroxy-3-cyclohexene-1-carboxylic-acid synthase [Longimicrobiales bacterium]
MSTGASRANQTWAETIAAALVASGVRTAAVAPGSRSTPLVLALSRRTELRLVECLDERSAAFFALGVGRATRVPAAVVTTSGTAVANLLPAALEAAYAEVPLILLTADRPPALRGSDANQTIDQAGLFGGSVRMSLDPGLASADDDALRVLAAQVARAAASARGRPAGPVHINVPFAKPLEPDRWPPPDAPAEPPVARHHAGAAAPAHAVAGEIASALAAARRPLLVCGAVPDPAAVAPEAIALAEAAGAPVIADPLSGARFAVGAVGVVAGAADRLLSDPGLRSELAPDFVLRVGASPTSPSVGALLEAARGTPQVVLDGGGRWKDHQALATTYVRADEALSLAAIRSAVAGADGADEAWRNRWARAEAAAQEAFDTALEEASAGEPRALFEGALARVVAAAAPAGGAIFVSSSMPVRDLDAFAAPRNEALTVYGNRGASGIDGIVSSALGVAAALPQGAPPLLALIGDLALLHDANGLALAAAAPSAVFVVVNNDGGGIFQLLPIREYEPEFTRYFATPHGRDLSTLAAFHGLAHERCDGPVALADALGRRLADGAGGVVEVVTDRERNRLARERVTAAAVAAAAHAI